MPNHNPIIVDRIRNIRQCTFGWVDHNFLHRGFINRLSQPELLLYYFLITVADRNGVSFYDYERICHLLKLKLNDYIDARNRLCDRSLIAFEDNIFQVLSLPKTSEIKPVPRLFQPNLQRSTDEFKSFKEIFNNIGR